MKTFLLTVYNFLYDLKGRIADAFWCVFDFFYSRIKPLPSVASVDETIDTLLKTKCSFARFGDGEIKLVAGKNISFQDASPFVVSKMREVLSSDADGLEIGLADIFGDRSRYSAQTNSYWKKHLTRYRKVWYKYIVKGKKYLNASVTRQYITLENRAESAAIFDKFKQLWDGENIVFVEGEKSRLGVGNDLFDNAESVRRILCPSTQAFSKYDEIIAEVKKLDKDVLILIALGPCATALAFDFHKLGFRAVDIGHIDIEYEWMKSGTKDKIPVTNKMTFEAGNYVSDGTFYDEKYESEIIARII